jgi:hypothetical protein
MAADSMQQLAGDKSVVALHACGDLHVRLLQLASQQGCPQLAVAPCCYNRIQGEQYKAISTAAQASALQLSIGDLGLPLSETVTSGARVRRQRDSSMARRLGFDLLQRQQRGIDAYLPTPSLPVDWLKKPFEQYCRDLAALRQVELSGTPDWAALEVARLATAGSGAQPGAGAQPVPPPIGTVAGARSSLVPSRARLCRARRTVLRIPADAAQPVTAGRTRRIAAAQLTTCG